MSKQSDNTIDNCRYFRVLPDFDRKCKECSLSNNTAVGGHTYSKIENTKLIVIAAYPGRLEVEKNLSLFPNQRSTDKVLDAPNAGRLFKASIVRKFDQCKRIPDSLKPFYSKIMFTNMIKCHPFNYKYEKASIRTKNIRSCKEKWLVREIEEVSKFNPTCPILLCGSEATKLLGEKKTVYSNRRKVFYYKNTHPVLVTFNPIELCRYNPKIIVEQTYQYNGKLSVKEVKPKSPIVIGSTMWHWNRDLELLKEIVIDSLKV